MATQAACPAESTFSTLVATLGFRAEQQADRTAYTFLLDGESHEIRLSYGQLDRQARAIGAWLQDAGVSGEPALLLYPPGLDFIAAFFGCLYGGMIAVPTYPPHPVRASRTLPRLRAILETARPKAVLTTSELLPVVKALLEGESGTSVTCCLATDQISSPAPGGSGDIGESQVAALADRWRPPTVSDDSLALVQFTSGSTGAPHGVMVSHANLRHNSEHICRLFRHTPDSRGLIWLPPYHDMGLIGGIIQPLYAGFEVNLMSPLHFLQQPIRWLRAVARTRATTSGGPNFAYDLCVDRVAPEDLIGLDLSSWDVAFTGAEPIRAETLDRFADAFAPYGFRREAFYPCYGLAEATLIASGGVKSTPYVVYEGPLEPHRPVGAADGTQASRRYVGCGRALADQDLAIVDPERFTRCGPGQVGEIWIRGASVAKGYWNRAERTRETFAAFVAGSGEGPFMRTGDLGFSKDGELFVTGRLKDLIIIDGRNHYPHDIEETVQRSHPAIRPHCCAAFSIERDDQEQVFVVTEIERQYRPRRVRADLAASVTQSAGSEGVPIAPGNGAGDLQNIVRAIRRAVAEHHDLRVSDVRLLKPGTIMKTASGKIQRHACRSRYLEGTLDEV
jgi:acyl-CoA synthetase (AMP-forming)/AMP-acid ligase II